MNDRSSVGWRRRRASEVDWAARAYDCRSDVGNWCLQDFDSNRLSERLQRALRDHLGDKPTSHPTLSPCWLYVVRFVCRRNDCMVTQGFTRILNAPGTDDKIQTLHTKLLLDCQLTANIAH